MNIQPFLYIAPSDKGGRGVFTSKKLKAGTLLEISPVLVLSAAERKAIEDTRLFHYVFEWGETKKKVCVAFGFVSMYNHSYHSSCEYEMDYELETITIRTVKAVEAGEELTINYNADPNDEKPLWFHSEVND